MFEFTSSLFFWTIINFLVLLFLVNKFALPAFFKMVEDNEAKKREAMADLQRNREESKRLFDDYQSKLSGIQDEARAILNEARKEKEEIKKRELEKLLQEKQDILSSIKKEILNEKKRFIEDMKEHAADLIVLASKKVIAKNLSTEDQLDVILQNITDFEASLKS
jgi:F-type H+-transporting ATPase subunit b